MCIRDRNILRFVAIPAITVSQTQVDYEDFARIGVKTRIVMPRPENVQTDGTIAVSYTHLRAHETRHDLVCRLLLEKKKKKTTKKKMTRSRRCIGTQEQRIWQKT